MSVGDLPKRAYRSLQKLAHVMGPEVLTLRIETFKPNQYTRAPAFTTNDGIYVSEQVVKEEPQNLGVYVGHEILHHVLADPVIRTSFDGEVTNVAEDYIINLILKKVYGLDVRKVGVRGIYDKRFSNKTLHQTCSHLANSGKLPVSGCGHSGVLTNARIYSVAAAIRARLMEHPFCKHLELGTSRDLVKLDDEQTKDLYEQLMADHGKSRHLRPMANVSNDLLVRALFGRLYSNTVRYDIRKDMRVLPHSFGIALAVQTAKLRKMTRNDPAMSLQFALTLVHTLGTWGTQGWRQSKSNKLVERIERLQSKVHDRKRYSKAERAKFQKSIERGEAKLERLAAERPLDDLLQDNANRLLVRPRKERTGSAISDALEIREDYLPAFRKNVLVERVRRICRSAYRELRAVYDIHARLGEFVQRGHKKVNSVLEDANPNDNTPKTETAERQRVPRPDPRPILPTKRQLEQEEREREKEERRQERERAREERERLKEEKRLAKQKAKQPKGDEGNAEEELQKIEPDDDSGESESPEPTESDEDEPEYGSEDAAEDEDESPEAPSEDAEEDGGRTETVSILYGVGDGDGDSQASLDMRTLDCIRLNKRLLKRILIEADLFHEKLANAAKANPDPDAAIDRTYTFGDDIPKADTSSLVKMVNASTRLAFFADVANQSLLQHVGSAPRRGPIIIALDCSDSMMGERYVVAAGFALAMFRVMSDIRKGCALVKFSSNVDGVYVSDPLMPLDMLMLLETLVSPSYGGTCFDSAIEQSLMLVETLGWKNPQMILVTDGDGVISPGLAETAAKKMRTAGLIVCNPRAVIKGISDLRYADSIEDLRTGMLTVGRSML